jgi:hypothetical protein
VPSVGQLQEALSALASCKGRPTIIFPSTMLSSRATIEIAVAVLYKQLVAAGGCPVGCQLGGPWPRLPPRCTVHAVANCNIHPNIERIQPPSGLNAACSTTPCAGVPDVRLPSYQKLHDEVLQHSMTRG